MTQSSANDLPFHVDAVQFDVARAREQRGGLLGYVSFRLNRGLRIDGVAVRRAQDGRPYLSFPVRRSVAGNRFYFVTPIDTVTRRDIERQVFAAIELMEDRNGAS